MVQYPKTKLQPFLRNIVFLIAVGTILGTHGASAQQSPIVDWYPSVDSMTQFPPIDQELSMVEKKVGKYYVTFVGVKGQSNVLIAAITLKPIKDVKSISLIVDFDGIKPKMGEVSTWAYVYDRNRDGKVDYLALLTAAAAYEGDDFPENYPIGKNSLNKAQQEYFIGHAKLVFDHWADDNFDGKLDAAVVNDCDPLRDMVMQQLVIRSSKFNDSLDDAWTFRMNIKGERVNIPHSPKRIPYRTIGKGDDAITKASFQEKDAILDLINKAAKELKFDEENFYHPEDRE